MPRTVNPERRRYESPRRREQAAATRRQILGAAQRLFEAQGYAATTMASIADEASVSLKTVYLAFDTKSGLVRSLWDTLLRGEADIAVAQQPWYVEVLDEPDPARQLRLNARNSTAVKQRVAGLLRVLRDGAPSDPDVAALWQLINDDFYANQREIVTSLHRKKALKRGLGVDHATDIVWTLIHPDVWHLLVGARGWSPSRYERWLADTTCEQLLARA
ncbi:MAG TPA: helix-turn-helix domain-containing protein [Acidimicrobiales bacterium]|nr:helix-turn-helix domain-containing protein [Acidimicrobiales bacterium]